MEEKFDYTKHNNFRAKQTTNCNTCHRSYNQQHLSNDNQSEQQKFINDLAVVPSNLQVKAKSKLKGLPVGYHQLVRNIKCKLPKKFINSGVCLAAAVSHKLAHYRQLGGQEHDSFEQTSSGTICFLKLFRKRMYYEQLGISLTPLELINMADCDSEMRRAKASKSSKKSMVQHDYDRNQGDCDQSADYFVNKSRRNESPVELTRFDSQCVCCQAEQRQLSGAHLPPPPPPPSDHLEQRETLFDQQLHKQLPYGYSHRCVSAAQAVQFDSVPGKFHALRRAEKITNLPSQIMALAKNEESNEYPPMGQELLQASQTARMYNDRDAVKESSSLAMESLGEFNMECPKTSSDMTVASVDTLNEVWYNPYVYQNPTDKCPIAVEFVAIDAQRTGHKGAKQLEPDAYHLAMQRNDYLSRRYATMPQQQRGQETAQRLRQLRFFQEKITHKFHRQLLLSGQSGNREESVSKLRDCFRFDCPMQSEQCQRLLNETLLSHFIETHLNMPGLQLNEILEHTKQLIKFRPSTFMRTHNICMSIAVLDGFRDASIAPIYNMGLTLPFAKFTGHLPFFVMARRIWLNEAEDHNLQESLEDNVENAMALWVAGLDLPQSIFAHLTVFNHRLDISRSGIVKVRGLSANHNAKQFMAGSRNFLRLNAQDLQLLTNNCSESIYLEISFRYFGLPDCV